MNVVYLTRIHRFNAGHRLFNPAWDDARNWETFGKCSLPDGHGHNYVLETTVRGTPDPATGWVVPPSMINRAVEEEVMNRLDHRNLNGSLKLEYGCAPTTEVLVLELWDALTKWIEPPAALYRLKVSETDKNTFEYFGPQSGQPSTRH